MISQVIRESNELINGIQYLNSMDLTPRSPVGALEARVKEDERIRHEYMISKERNGTAEEVSAEELDWLIGNSK